MNALEFIAENFERFERLCDGPDHDERWDIIMDRVPGMLKRWDGERSVWTYITVNLRWYFHKLEKRRRTLPLDIDVECNRRVDSEVLELVDRLDEYDRGLLIDRFVLGFNRSELAAHHGVSIETIKKDTARALRHARHGQREVH